MLELCKSSTFQQSEIMNGFDFRLCILSLFLRSAQCSEQHDHERMKIYPLRKRYWDLIPPVMKNVTRGKIQSSIVVTNCSIYS